jgi:hypothetical protein
VLLALPAASAAEMHALLEAMIAELAASKQPGGG